MNTFKIEHSTINDLAQIYQLYDEAIAFQKEQGLYVWNGYDKDIIVQEIETKKQYNLLLEDEIVAFFSLCEPSAVEHELWKERVQDKAVYLHRIVSNRKFKGIKCLTIILDWVTEKIKAEGIALIRMDTWADNLQLVNYYKRFGFKEEGIVYSSHSEDIPLQYRGEKNILLEKNILI